jgi:hypothetical protein
MKPSLPDGHEYITCPGKRLVQNHQGAEKLVIELHAAIEIAGNNADMVQCLLRIDEFSRASHLACG